MSKPDKIMEKEFEKIIKKWKKTYIWKIYKWDKLADSIKAEEIIDRAPEGMTYEEMKQYLTAEFSIRMPRQPIEVIDGLIHHLRCLVFHKVTTTMDPAIAWELKQFKEEFTLPWMEETGKEKAEIEKIEKEVKELNSIIG